MGVKVLFALICIAVAEAKPTENNEDFNIVAVASNFATTDLDADRGKLPGKKLPLEVLKEMEANARKAGCTRGCLICLSHIKCTPKMKKFIPGRCHTYEGDKESAQGGIGEAIVDIPEIPGFKDLEPMEQFIAQVDLCVDCTTGCLKGLANVQCSDLLKKWLPQRCATFASKIQGQVDKIKGAGGDGSGATNFSLLKQAGDVEENPGPMVSKGEEVIKEFMRFKVRMEGSMNGHEFEIEGEGEGRPYEGTQTAKLKVTKGGPLPFAWDILSPQFMYGSKAYVKHPADIPDYKKLSFPEGFKWERVMNFEDGGLVTVTQDSSLQDGTLIYKVKMRGTNFPPDGPVMQKKTMGWEASTERLYPRDGVLKGEIHQALKLKDGGHYLVEFKTIYMAKKPVQLPGYYYVDTKLDITSHNEDYTIVEQYERSEGRHHLFLYGMDELYK